MEPSIINRITRVMGFVPVAWEVADARGCTHNKRWLVRLGDGRSVFVKGAVDARTADWLRKEYFVYSRLSASFMPALYGWCEDGWEWPLLIIEDLHNAHWPPPWSAASIKAVRETLEVLAAIPVTDELREALPSAEESLSRWPGWRDVAEDPEPFLSLGLCSSTWLDKHLAILMAAASAAHLKGNALLHMDTRSDNLCLRDGKALLVDWNWTRIGNPLLDLAGWLPSLHAEGGPPPEEILPEGAGELAALFSGYWASQAGLPIIPHAPRVRPMQLMQLRSALPWTARVLELPPPDKMV